MTTSGFEPTSSPWRPLYQSLPHPATSPGRSADSLADEERNWKYDFVGQESLRFSWQHEPADVTTSSPFNIRENIPLADIFSTGNLPRKQGMYFWIWELKWEKKKLLCFGRWEAQGTCPESRETQHLLTLWCVWHPGRDGGPRREGRGPLHNFFTFLLSYEEWLSHRHLDAEQFEGSGKHVVERLAQVPEESGSGLK